MTLECDFRSGSKRKLWKTRGAPGWGDVVILSGQHVFERDRGLMNPPPKKNENRPLIFPAVNRNVKMWSLPSV